MTVLCAVRRPVVVILIASLSMLFSGSPAAAQTPPSGNNTEQFGLLADPGDPIIISVTGNIFQPFNLCVFDRNGNIVTSSSGTPNASLVAILGEGTYFLAAWNGLTPAFNGFQFANVIPADDFSITIDGTKSDYAASCPRFGTLGFPVQDECLFDVTYYEFYVGAPTSEAIDRGVLTTRAEICLRQLREESSQEWALFREDGTEVSTTCPASYEPGRYYAAFFPDGFVRATTPFRINLNRDPESFNYDFRANDTAFAEGSVGVGEIVWRDFEIRDEGPDTVLSAEFADFGPIEITMTSAAAPLVSVFGVYSASNGELVARTFSNTQPATTTVVLAAGEYIVAAGASPTNFQDDLLTLALVTNPGGGYDMSIGQENFPGQMLEPGGDIDFFRFTVIGTCNAADRATPYGVLDSDDIELYLSQVNNGSAADFDGEPGLTFFDVLAFLRVFDEGCPAPAP